MSFLDEVFSQVCNMHLPVTSIDVCMAMKSHNSVRSLSPAAQRDKIRKALSDLRHKRGVLTAKNDNDGLLWWDLTDPVELVKGAVKMLPEKLSEIPRWLPEKLPEPLGVATLPEKLPELPKEPCPTLVVHKQLLVDIGNAFLKAAADL